MRSPVLGYVRKARLALKRKEGIGGLDNITQPAKRKAGPLYFLFTYKRQLGLLQLTNDYTWIYWQRTSRNFLSGRITSIKTASIGYNRRGARSSWPTRGSRLNRRRSRPVFRRPVSSTIGKTSLFKSAPNAWLKKTTTKTIQDGKTIQTSKPQRLQVQSQVGHSVDERGPAFAGQRNSSDIHMR